MAKQRRNEKGLGHKKSDWGEKEKGTNLVTWRWRVSEEVWRRFQRQKEGEERKEVGEEERSWREKRRSASWEIAS